MHRIGENTNITGVRDSNSTAHARLVISVVLSSMAMLVLAPALAEASTPTPYLYVAGGQANVSAKGAVSVVNTSTNTRVATVPVGTEPTSVAIMPNGAFAYVANSGIDSSVSVIKTFTNEVVATVPVGGRPHSIDITPNGGRAYVGNFQNNNVSVIDTATNSVITSVPVGGHPSDIAITPSGLFAYVINGVTVSVISTSTNAVVDTVSLGLGSFPSGIAVTPNGASAYVSELNQIEVISTATNSIVATVTGISEGGDIAITPNGAAAYAAEGGGFAVINTALNAIVGSIPEYRGEHVAITPDGSSAYMDGAFELAEINTGDNSVIAKIVIPEYTRNGMAITPPITIAEPGRSPPKVTITSHPPKETPHQSAVFAFTGEGGGSYQCSIDTGPWRSCGSGERFGLLAPGDHRFRVRETLNGLTGPADSYTWTVDLPRACVLRVARARVFVFAHQSRVRLVIHYKAYRPTQVTVSYKLKGSKGNLSLGNVSARFKRAGIFRLPESLRKGQTAKLRATKSLKVHFAIPTAPDRCNRYYTKRLTISKKIFGQTVWFQSDSRFAPEKES